MSKRVRRSLAHAVLVASALALSACNDATEGQRVTLFQGSMQSVNGRLVEGSFTAADVTGVSYETLVEQMRTGAAYVNVHTTQFPGGEIRGQTELVR
jgi:hypothetical protein